MSDLYASHRLKLAGGGSIAAFVAAFAAWIVMIEVPSAVQVGGQFSPAGLSQEIRAFKAGHVSSVAVRDGQSVSGGEEILALDATQSGIQRDAMREALIRYWALKVRLEAELAGSTPDFSSIPEDLRDPAVIQRELEHYLARSEHLALRALSLRDRQSSLSEMIQELIAAEEVRDDQLRIQADHRDTVTSLTTQAYATRDKLVSAELMITESMAEKAALRLSRLQNEAALAQASAELRMIATEHRAEVMAQLAQADAEVARYRAQVELLSAQVAEMRVLAPVNGVILMPKKPRPGAVVSAGEVVARIVPEDEPLIFEGILRPEDADNVQVGMAAAITPTGLKSRSVSDVTGKVVYLSADSIRDERTGQYHFLVHIEVDRGALVAAFKTEPFPGMPASASIQAGSRTVMEYFVKPIRDSFRRAMHED